MPTILKGATLSEGPLVSSWKPKAGGSTKRTFTGTESEIVNQAVYLQSLGYETIITAGPVYTLEATVPVDEVTDPDESNEPETVWEMSAQAFERNILECVDRPIVSPLSTKTKALIEAAIKYPKSNHQLTTTAEVSQLPYAQKVYNLMRVGVEGKQAFIPTIKRNIVVSSNYNVGWIVQNVGRVWSKERLIANYAVPTQMWNIIPGTPYDSDPNRNGNWVTDTNGITSFWGWLESYPTYQTTGNNKVQIAQEWLYNKWSAGNEGLYDVNE